MKKIIMIAFMILYFGSEAQVTIQRGTGPHGGALNVTRGYKIELVSSYGCVVAYVYDKDLSLLSNKDIAGEIMFVYSDNANLNKQMFPYEGEGLMAEVSNPYYIYSVLTLKISGKMITSKFMNQYGLADKENKKSKKQNNE